MLGLLLALVLAVAALPASTSADPTCTDTWTGSAGDGLWQSAGNWSNGVPTSSDVACVEAGASVQVSSGTEQASVLVDHGTVTLSGGSLELASTSEASSAQALSLAGGTLTIVHELDVSGSLTTSGTPTIAGAGKLVVGASVNGSVNASSCSSLTLDGIAFDNEGTLIDGAAGGAGDGAIAMRDGAQLRNAGTFTVSSWDPGCGYGYGGKAIVNAGGAASSILNTGTLHAGAGGETIVAEVPLTDDGTAEVNAGKLELRTGGGGSGNWVVPSGTTLAVPGGSFALTGGGFSGAGTVALTGAAVSASAAVKTASATTFAVSGGSLAIAHGAAVEVAGSLSVNGEPTLSGEGSLVVGSGATAALGGSGSCSVHLTINGGTLRNEGTLTFGSGSDVGAGAIAMQNGAQLQNAGTFDDNSYDPGCGYGVGGDQYTVYSSGGAASSFVNTGTLDAEAGSGALVVAVPFTNEATAHAVNGTLRFAAGGNGAGATWSAAAGAGLGFSGGSFTLAGDTWSGAVSLTGAAVNASHLNASGVALSVGSGSLTIPEGSTTSVSSLTLSGGTLATSGELDTTGSLSVSGEPTLSGAGRLLVGSGASAAIGNSGSCSSHLVIDGGTLVNDGTLTFGSGSDVGAGAIAMRDGGHIQNAGTFDDNSYDPGCGYGVGGDQYTVYSTGGAESSIENTGSWQAEAGSSALVVAVPFDNQGSVVALSGTLRFAAGGVPGRVAAGVWSVHSGAAIVLSGGTFLIGEEVDLSSVQVSGATVERAPVAGAPRGYLNALPYVSGTVSIVGFGHSVGTGFSAASIELSPAGEESWKTLCSSLGPSLGGEFSCEWHTASGSYPDGDYKARAQLSDASQPPNTAPTAAITMLVDNTPPSGSATPPAYIGGSAYVGGTAHDAGSGVASWQLQIAPSGGGEWTNACAAQTVPTSGESYRCSVATATFAEGQHPMRAIVTDNAGNTYATATATTTIDNTPPTGSLAPVAEGQYVRGTLAVGGTAADTSSGVASWTPQVAVAGSGSWSDACTPQTAPSSGSTYGCALETSHYADGAYQVRAEIQDNAGNVYDTAAQSVTIDNTPPIGSLDQLARVSAGVITVKGPASDATSGVASWQLQVTSTGQHSWQNACPAQLSPAEGLEYGCAIDTTTLADGSYQLRAVITDNAGNVYTTRPVATRVHNGSGSEGPETSCTDTWTGTAGDGSFATAGNWSTGSVPGSSDRACIPAGASVQVGSSAQVGSITGEGQITVAGTSLELADSSTVSEIGVLSLQGGTLVDPGALAVYGSFTSSGNATVSGAGELVVAAGASGTIDAASCSLLTLNGTTLLNGGTLTLGASGGQSGQLDLQGGQLQNTGTFNADSYPASCVPGSNSASIQSNGGSPTITNTGTFDVDVGAGGTTTANVPFDNQGTVHVQSGTFAPNGGGSSSAGAWSTASGSAVAVTSSFSLTGTNASGADFAVSAGTLSVSGATSTVGTLALTGGTVNVAGELDVSASLNGVGAGHPTITGGGKLAIESGASGVIDGGACSSGGGDFFLNGAELVNEGTLTLGTPGGGANGDVVMSNGAQLRNAGTLNADMWSNDAGPCNYTNYTVTGGGGATSTVTNTGTLNTDVGAGDTALIGVPLDNEGTVTVTSGSLSLAGGGAETAGSWSPAAGSTISLAGGSFSSAGDTWSGAGTVAVTGGTVAVTGLKGSVGQASVAAGSLTVPAGTTSSVSSLTLAGGTIGVAGQLDVTSSFIGAGAGHPTITGGGSFVLRPGASGTIDGGACNSGGGDFSVNGAQLVNEGTLTLGTPGGGANGDVVMSSGAQLRNAGTLNADMWSNDAGPCNYTHYTVANGGGATSTVTNTGTLNTDVGAGDTALIGVPLESSGTVHVQSGALTPMAGGSSSGGTWTTATGAAASFTSNAYTLSGVDASGAYVALSGGTLTAETPTTTVGTLALGGGSLSVAGELDVTGSFSGAGAGHPTITGGGSLVLRPGASGTIDSGACNSGGGDFFVNGASLVNQGTLTLGTPGGGANGDVVMSNGAQLQNAGTLNADMWSNDAGPCNYTNYTIANGGGGTTPTVTNTGTLNTDVGAGHTALVGVPFANESTVNVTSGSFALADGGSGSSSTWSVASGTAVAFTGGPFSSAADTWSGAGTVAVAGAAVTATGLKSSGANVALSSGSLTIPAGTTSSVSSLTVTSGSLSVAGELDVTGSFSGAGAGHPTITGGGSLVLRPGASGTIDSGACNSGGGDFFVNGASLVNQGTLTLGTPGGGANGDVVMSNGAQLQNAGTLNADMWSNDAGPCNYTNYTIANGGGGTTPTVTNTGTLSANVGAGNTALVGVPFLNDGTVTTQDGTIAFSGGGGEGVAKGSWRVQEGPIDLRAGSYRVEEGVEFDATIEGGATVIWVPHGLTGTIAAPTYGVGTIAVTGSARGGAAGPFAGATVEAAPDGSREWSKLCGPLSPGLGGAFECAWATSGYADGYYQVRATLESGGTYPETAVTPTVEVLVDNTPPSGALTTPSTHGVGGSTTITGTASDAGSGVQSWQLQALHEGGSEWSNACGVQSAPLAGEEYGCAIDTTKYSEGALQLRAVIHDRAGNAYTTPAVTLHVNNSAVKATLTEPPWYMAGSVELEGTASTASGSPEGWTPQVAPLGTSAWSDACETQKTPVSAQTYRCRFDTTAKSDGRYEVRAVATDAEGDVTTTAPVMAVIDNTAPVGFLYPLPESVSGNYEVLGQATDVGSGVASWTLEVAPASGEGWHQACLPQTAAIFASTYGCTLEAGALENGEYRLRAVIVDNAGNRYTTASIPATVDNAAPVSTAAPTVSGRAIAGHQLHATAGAWSGAAPIVYAYQWQRCNAAGEGCAAIEGATSSTYVLSGEDVGHAVRVSVTATNGTGSASASSSPTSAIAANTLGDLSAPTIAGRPAAGGTLTAEPGEWAGGAPIAYAYQWQRCNASGEACANLTGATAKTYQPSEADISGTLRVVVTASNGEGSASATSAASGAVTPSSGAGIRYLYDQAGRLAVVDDPSKGAARYRWDPDGNLLGIERFATSTLSVLGVAPTHAPVGASIDLTGTGFDTNAADDEVSFDGGASGTVTQAGATDLVVTVPAGAKTGYITVTVSGKTATSVDSFAPEEGPSGGGEMAARMGRILARTAGVLTARPAAPATAVPTSSAALLDAARRFTPKHADAWLPTGANTRDENWVSGEESTPWSRLPSLSAASGTTALSGQALTVNGRPLAGVTLSLQGSTTSTQTDATGRFLLTGAAPGHQVLVIDGTSAHDNGRRYGRFSVAVEVAEGRTTPLGYTIWMTPLDPAGNQRLPSPLTHEDVLTNPRIPGLEVRLPAGTVVRSASGEVVRRLNLTAIPVDRPPFPLPLFATGVPTYFTVQPGGAYLNKGAQIVYPNWGHLPPGQRVDFWNYDPADKGWYVYGKGTVSADGRQVVPDPGVRVWELTGAMITTEREAPENGPESETEGGDPVDLASGLFVYHHTDLQLPDSLMPVALTRTYRQRDHNSYSFGIGTQSVFDIHLWSNENYRTAYLVLPNGAKIKFVRTSPGSGYAEAVYTATETPGAWEGATFAWNAAGFDWVMRRRDGMKFVFGELAPLQAIEDRNGNRITLVREGGKNGPIVQIRTPHGRSINLTYDSSGRIVAAGDSGGQIVHYEYDGSGRLVRVTDPAGHVTSYQYNSSSEMTKVIDARGHAYIENSYGSLERVSSQTIGGGTYEFGYEDKTCGGAGGFPVYGPERFAAVRRASSSGGGGVSVSPPCYDYPGWVKTPTGVLRDVFYDEKGRLSKEVLNPDGSPYVVRDYAHDKNGNLDTLTESRETYSEDAYRNRHSEAYSNMTTRFTRDAGGDATAITHEGWNSTDREHRTNAPELTTHLTYNEFAEPLTITDPLGRTTRFGYDANGNETSIATPMGRTTTLGYDGEGQLVSLTDPEGNTTQYGYEDGEQVTSTDPLGHQTRVEYDSLGRPVGVRNAEGGLTELTYDKDSELTSETDPAGEKTSYGYDADGDLTSVTDPRGHTQTATYTAIDQLATWTDALNRTTSYGYDGMGHLTSTTDARGQTTAYDYNALDQLTSASFGAVGGGSPTSSITYGYDNEGNLVSAADSRNGTYTLSYDLLHRLTGINGPNGSVGYSYDVDGERTGMTVGGEEAASYSYNEDGQLTGIASPSGDVAFNYDGDGRSAQTTLPDGIRERYSYDAASQLSGIDYAHSDGSQIGNLEYSRNALGLITTLSGSLARTNLPEAVGGLSYDNANELTAVEGRTLSYDADGNLTGDGASTYTWNDRGQLSGLTQGATTWSYGYDPFGLRASKTVGGSETRYLNDGGNVVTESTGGSTTRMLNGLGLDERYARTSAGATQSYLTDELGSTVALADAGGTPTTEYTYDPFGATSTAGASSTNPYQFTGMANEGNGLQYDRARYYDMSVARFVSQDPLGITGSGINLYQYVAGDPINGIDPTGLEGILESLGNGVTGFVDTATGGATTAIRGALGLAQPNKSSASYEAGSDAGLIAATITPGDEEAAIADVAEQGASNLSEQLALEEAQAGAGTRIMEGQIKDPKYPEDVWAKMQHVHRNPDGTKITIHYWENLQTGAREGFKFK